MKVLLRLMLLLPLVFGAAQAAATRAPNIVFIFTDAIGGSVGR